MNEATEKVRTRDVRPRPGEMIKPGEIIGIAGLEDWTLADRKTWNMLLLNAWGDRLEDPTADFFIPLRDLRGLHDSNDRVRSSLHKLQQTLVMARMGDGKTRSIQMLGGCDIDDDDRKEGLLKYDFHRKLVPLLRKSEIYARMELKVMSAMTSKYSLALYESLALRVNLRKQEAEISIERLREMLSVAPDKLGRWVDLNRFAIAPAVKEVNALSSISVKIRPKPVGRKVMSVIVSWEKKTPFSPEEQKAAREVNQPREGRGARIAGKVEAIVRELSPAEILKGWEAAAPICKLDKTAAYEDWRAMVTGFEVPPTNPVGHFIDFCKKRAREAA